MTPTAEELVRFVYREARLLDEGRLEAWLDLFTEDGLYWVPLSPGQTDPDLHNSLACEDLLLLRLRVERLRSPRAFSQHPPSRGHHLLQTPEVETEDVAPGTHRLRTPFLYTESQGDTVHQFAATAFHTLVVQDGRLRLRQKRVDLLNADAALPSIQLFP